MLELAISRQFEDVFIFLLSQQLVELYYHLAARYSSASLLLRVFLVHVAVCCLVNGKCIYSLRIIHIDFLVC